jgi:hypothetical protein
MILAMSPKAKSAADHLTAHSTLTACADAFTL